MLANRRRFLSLLGVGAASAPLAAKAAADAEIAKLANIGAYGIQVGGIELPGVPQALQQVYSYEQTIVKASDYIKLFGIPDVIKQRIRDNSQYVHGLDVDLASKKSWSMAVKIQEQRTRNYNRQIKEMEAAGWKERGRQALQKTMGFTWPW